MQTYSHLIITGAVSMPLKRRDYPVHLTAFLLGSVIPDIPFFVLTILGGIYFTWLAPVPTGESPLIYMHMTLYFTDPLWLLAHNFFHAPLILIALGLIGYWGIRTGRSSGSAWGGFLLWFALGAGLHSAIDILTHAGDGPLLLFPLNWTYRFSSPVSYWDPEYYGRIFAPIEHVLDVVLLIYIFVNWRRNRAGTQKASAAD